MWGFANCGFPRPGASLWQMAMRPSAQRHGAIENSLSPVQPAVHGTSTLP